MNNPSKTILFYISGHGFGHARRCAQIIAALRHQSPSTRVAVRTIAPASIFIDVGLSPTDIQSTDIDPGVVEHDAWTVDPIATAARFISLHDRREEIVKREVMAIGPLKPSLIVSDIPSLAGAVATTLDVPCIASGNFTWDWILQPMLANHPRGIEVLQATARDYQVMAAVLRHPFSHEMPEFPRVIDIPIVAHSARDDPNRVLTRLDLDAADPRPRVLLAMRGGSSADTLIAGARSMPDVMFTTTQNLPIDAPSNLRQIHLASVDFADAMAVHHAVISKLGYGIVCDAIAARTRLLWPRRLGFREDELFECAAPPLLPMREIPRDDYAAGSWQASLQELLAAPLPNERPAIDGAKIAANHLVRESDHR